MHVYTKLTLEEARIEHLMKGNYKGRQSIIAYFPTRAQLSAATAISPNTIAFSIPTSTAARYTETTTSTSTQ